MVVGATVTITIRLEVNDAMTPIIMAKIGSKGGTRLWNEAFHQFGGTRRDHIPEIEIEV